MSSAARGTGDRNMMVGVYHARLGFQQLVSTKRRALAPLLILGVGILLGFGAYRVLRTGKAVIREEQEIKEDEKRKEQYNKENADAYYRSGDGYYKMGKYGKAIPYYDKAIELNPNHALAYFNRAYAYGEIGNYDKAIADYSKTIELNPGDAQAYYNRGFDYDNKGEVSKAVSDLERCVGLSTDPELTKDAQQALLETKNSTRGKKAELLMKYCPNCGRAGVGGIKFCPQCGERLTDFYLEEEQRYVHQPEEATEVLKHMSGGIKKTERIVWENILSPLRKEELSLLSIGSMKEAKQIIDVFFVPDKIYSMRFLSNFETLLRQGMPSLRDIADSEKNPQPTRSVSQFIAVMDRPVGMPLWFIAAYPDVLLWYDNQVGEYMKAQKPDRDSLVMFNAKLFGIDPTDPNLEKELSDSADKEGKLHPNILRNLVQSYKDKTGRELETAATGKWYNQH